MACAGNERQRAWRGWMGVGSCTWGMCPQPYLKLGDPLQNHVACPPDLVNTRSRVLRGGRTEGAEHRERIAPRAARHDCLRCSRRKYAAPQNEGGAASRAKRRRTRRMSRTCDMSI